MQELPERIIELYRLSPEDIERCKYIKGYWEDKLNIYRTGGIPKTFRDLSYGKYNRFGVGLDGTIDFRTKFIEEVGYILISEDWIKPLARWLGDRPCLEIMAGSGRLSKELEKQGVKIKATDDFSWDKQLHIDSSYVERLDCLKAIDKYGSQVKFIICSWPYMDWKMYRCLLKMREVNPKCRLIYIGEDFGGCTADDDFFNVLEECNVQGFKEAVSSYRRWEGIHDHILLIK